MAVNSYQNKSQSRQSGTPSSFRFEFLKKIQFTLASLKCSVVSKHIEQKNP